MKFKAIEGYKGLYEISRSGTVRSIPRTVVCRDGSKKPIAGKELKHYLGKNGYYSLSLWKGNLAKTYYVHRLIALAYLPNYENKPHINHKDGNPRNNAICNLEWCTASENSQHAYDIGLHKVVSRHSESEWLSMLNQVLRGTSYSGLSKLSNYKVVMLSTQVRKLARGLGLEPTLDSALVLQKVLRNERAAHESHTVLMLSLEGEPIRKFNSLQEATRTLGKKSSGSIANALNPSRSQQTAYGYKWSRIK